MQPIFMELLSFNQGFWNMRIDAETWKPNDELIEKQGVATEVVGKEKIVAGFSTEY